MLFIVNITNDNTDYGHLMKVIPIPKKLLFLYCYDK